MLPNASCVPEDSFTARADQRSYDDACGGGQLRPETSYSFIAGQVGDLIGGARLTAELIRRWESISRFSRKAIRRAVDLPDQAK